MTLEQEVTMLRAITRWMIALMVITGAALVLSHGVATNGPRAVAQTAARAAAPARSDRPRAVQRRRQDLIDDRSTVATPFDRPQLAQAAVREARGAHVATIRLVRQPDPRLVKALSEPTQAEFVEAPLQDVVDYFKDKHRVEIQIDTRAMEDESIGTGTPVTCNLKGVSLGETLDLILHQLRLVYVIHGAVVMITPEQTGPGPLSVRLYDCAWAAPDGLADLAEVVSLIDSGGAVALAGLEGAEMDGGAENEPAFRAVPYGSCLVVRASDIEHETVRRLLAELRAATESKGKTAAQQEPIPGQSKSAEP
jgi:hypothetical protein